MTGERQAPPRLSRRTLRSDRRRLAMTLLAVVIFGLISALVRWRTGDEAAGPSSLHYTLLVTNILLFVALLLSLLRYLIRLLSERRAGTLGSRFKFKLVASFIGLCLVPAVVLYVVAIAILFGAVNRTLGPGVDGIIADAQALTNQFLEDAQADVARELDELAAGLGRGALLTPERADELRAQLERQVVQRGLSAARLHFRGRAEVLQVAAPALAARTAHSPLDPADVLAGELEADLAQLLAGRRFTRRWQREGELFLVAAAPVVQAGHEGPAGALFVARRVPADIRDRVNRLNANRRQYLQLRQQVPWLKAEQALLFMGFSLLIIFGATWVGLYIARSITLPIERLAEGTVQVRKGNLQHRVEWTGTDELAMLVEAFNQMAGDLAEKATEVEGKADELQRANLELARRRDTMERLLDTITAGVMALDPGGRIVVANGAARHVLQLPDSLVPGVHHAEALAGETRAALRREIQRALDRRPVRRSLEMVLLFDSGPTHLQVVLTDLPGLDAPRPGLLVLLEDVTELVRAQKLATWRAVARRIAHEIKNPLTPIQLSAQRMLKKCRSRAPDLPEVLEEGVETIIQEVRGLKQMVDEFSNFARMPEVRPLLGDVNTLLESVAALYAGHEALDLRLDLAADIPVVAFDPELLRRAVVNLVDNAVEATDGRGPVGMRSVLDADEEVVRIQVTDEGPGIPASEREQLFLPYFTTKQQGTGLGLAIVNRIMADHGGRVTVQDNAPRGARFTLELPLVRDPGSRPEPVGRSVDASRGGR